MKPTIFSAAIWKNETAPIFASLGASGDCTEIMKSIEDEGAWFVTKARLTRDLKLAIFNTKKWQTIEHDVDGRPLRQVANVKFERKP